MDAAKTMTALRRIDEQSRNKTALNAFHPLTHFLITTAYIVTVLSFGRYELSSLVPFVLYPLFALFFGGIPPGLIAKRVAIVMPALILLCIFNPILDKNQVLLGPILISAGWLSFLSLIVKCAFTVSASLILICVTGIDGICSALYSLRVPKLIVAQISFTYRYIHVLGEEIVRILAAYSLRSPRKRGVSLKQFGSICGGLFLRSIGRADAVYSAMRCRGFNGVMPVTDKNRFSYTDALYLCGWAAFFFAARVYDLPDALGNLLLG